MYGRAKRVHFEREEVAESRFSVPHLPSDNLELSVFDLGDALSFRTRTPPHDVVSSAVKSDKQPGIVSGNNASDYSFFTLPNSDFGRENPTLNAHHFWPSVKNVDHHDLMKNESIRISKSSSCSPHGVCKHVPQQANKSFPSTKISSNNINLEYYDHTPVIHKPSHSTCKCSQNCTETRVKSIPNKKRMFCKVRNKDSACSCRMKAISNGLDEKRHAILKTNNEQLFDDYDKCLNASISNEAVMDIESSNCETMADLFNIIKLQNKQLLALQQRVDRLLDTKKSEPVATNEIIITSQQNNLEMNTDNKCSETRENIEFEHIKQTNSVSSRPTVDEVHKISIGVMTSFEMVMSTKENQAALNFKINYADECVQTSNIFNEKTIDHNVEECRKKLQNTNIFDGVKQSDKKNNGSTKCEILAGIKKPAVKMNENINLKNDGIDISCIAAESLILNFQQPQSPPITPQPSLHLDVRDYSDSDNDEASISDAGWTFYNNVMNRVNNILYDPSQSEKLSKKSLKHRLQTDHRSQRRHFETVDVNTSKRVTFETQDLIISPYGDKTSVSETSIHMKKLALKYLGNNSEEQKIHNNRTVRPKDNIYKYGFLQDIGKEMSFSTLQYMHKYHLLSGNPNSFPKVRNKAHQAAKAYQYSKPARKILDVTAIKQQPKLL